MKFRFLCFGSHLFISAVIGIALLLLVYRFWYPSPLDIALGVTDIFLLLLCVDIIVGPLLTFIVAKQGKKTLRTDLLTIGILQTAALLYGLHVVAQGRPVWIVYDSGRFELVQEYEAIRVAGEAISESGDTKLAGINLMAVSDAIPESINRQEVYYQGEYLKPYDESLVKARTAPLGLLEKFNDSAQVAELLANYPDAGGFIPLAAKQKALVVLIHKNSGMPLAIINLSPW